MGVWALADLLSLVVMVVVVVLALAGAPVDAVDGPDLLAIAEVDRSAAGRRDEPPSLEPDEERGLCWLSGLPWSPFSWGARVPDAHGRTLGRFRSRRG